ncbi:hypothetical protein HY68_25995 [Streptomyces sp. AcH 505]|uniref:hypothetical protein n=1 Tax=unclassified Streptomyces TaxID=2593676 RepID=UPI0005922F1E|nr:hypothetical protein [Streptomyces sp. NBC_00370]KIF71266.1 hypothetical protein HY68_25995 [Streptomyces sp. AcH 505]
MLRTALHRFTQGLRAEHAGRVQLPLPATLPASLGCDAVGVPARHGFRLMARLPRSGCVFADADWWWWIVPAGSDLELAWPEPARYVEGTSVPAARPRLIHWPDDPTPYTPPIPFYLMVCQLAGTAPAWDSQVPRTVPTPR